ncbi:MAG: hypothetical protein JRG83_02495 [Deltaproteobacteria bacterium]|nr:hypothetical protein [Deltaproteobacteria bacterium]
MDRWDQARELMLEFSLRTGLSPAGQSVQRYLWTDAFAVCNFLGISVEMGDGLLRKLALDLVAQVHQTLGRHRADDDRTGWISGLSEREGELHPTQGGMRIGKPLPERTPTEPFDEASEWNRDGQYFHYLTQWMRALESASRVVEEPRYHRWAVELAKTAHSGFTSLPGQHPPTRMRWKMSIDLRYPLVDTMGHHDPITGFVAYTELQATARSDPTLDLSRELSDLAAICEGQDLVTSDPLGIGGLLSDACRFAQLRTGGAEGPDSLIPRLLESALLGLPACTASAWWLRPAVDRLAFREFGLSIGLHGMRRLTRVLQKHPLSGIRQQETARLLDDLAEYRHLSEEIETFWLSPSNRNAESWRAHRDINDVMLATSLAPAGYLSA